MDRGNICSRRGFLAGALAFAGAVPALAEEPKVEIPAYNKMSDNDEIALGLEASREIEKQQKLKFVPASGVQDYAETLLAKIARTSRRPKLPYSVKIVDTEEINAFALPGGFVYLNRGIMEWSRSEAELAAVLSHEVGHVVGRHGANAVSRQTAADSLLNEASHVLFGDDAPARILKQIGGPVAMLALLRYSREQELEADLFGYYNIQRAGWDAAGMLDLFRHFGEKATALDPLFAIGSTHPAAIERESQIRGEMREFPPKPGLIKDSLEFRAAQAELKKLPRPPKDEDAGGN